MRKGRPIPEALRALRSFWIDDTPGSKNEAELRLGAIRDLARIAQMKSEDPAVMAQWVARWRKWALQRPGEMFWALYYADAGGPLLEELEALMARRPDETQARQAFVWFALQTGEFERLAAWLHKPERTTVDRDFLSVSLSEYLESSGGMGGTGAGVAAGPGREQQLLEKLFSDGYQLRRWQAAMIFANRGRFVEAVQLGVPVFESLSSQRPAYGRELAQWQIYLGNGAAARRLLGQSIGEQGDSFEAPVYHALRELYLLSPAVEQARFAEGFLSKINAQTQPLHAALSGVLLHGLAGNLTAARAQIMRLLELRPVGRVSEGEMEDNAASRFWGFVLSTGAQLQQWQMDSLAMHLWENALADEALVRLQSTSSQSDQIRARILEMRIRLAAVRITRAGAFGDIEPILTGFAAQAGQEGLLRLAESLETMGAYSRAIALYRRIWEKEPANPHALRNLLTACRTSKDSDTLIHVLGRCVNENIYRVNDVTHRDMVIQLADALEARGDFVRSREVLEAGVEGFPFDSRLLLRLGQLDQFHGRPVAAEGAYRRLLRFEPANMTARLALAALLENLGRPVEALALLEKSTGADAEMRRAALLLKANRLEEAFAALEKLPATHQLAATLLFSERLVEKNDLRAARGVLRNALIRLGDWRTGFPLQAKFIELLAPQSDRSVVALEFRRLRRMTGNAPELLAGYFDFARVQSARLGWEKEFDGELREDWAEGEGTLFAGALLLEASLAKGDTAGAEALWRQLLGRGDVSEALLNRLLPVFKNNGRADWAAAARGRLARLNPLDPARMVNWARSLALEAGGPDNVRAAMSVLEELKAQVVLNQDIRGQLGEIYAELGLPEEARPFLEKVLAGDPVARNFRAYLALARLQWKGGNFPLAKKLMLVAFKNPLNQECAEIVDCLKAQGALDRFEEEIAAFEFDSRRLLGVRRALFAEYERAGAKAQALALVEKFPAVADAGICARLRQLCAGEFQALSVVFERMRAQPGGHPEALTELTGVYADWAEAELAKGNAGAGMDYLRRANALQAGNWALALRLSGLLSTAGQGASAAQVLRQFMGASPNSAERTEARRLLETLVPKAP